MANSFLRIDYRLRPAKAVERRMMAEAFLRLRPFGAVEAYRYVGMGSVYFSDFTLFHSICGFGAMVSIEGTEDATVQERFLMNVPLGGINMLFGHSNAALPKLEWDRRSVVWLDYDNSLGGAVLTDVRYLASKMKSGSLLAVSVNADLLDKEESKKKPLDMLIQRLGASDKIPTEISILGHLPAAKVASTYRSILAQEIQDGLNDRNAGRNDGEKYCVQQVLFFRYADGAPMLTIAWVIFEEGQEQLVDQCDFKRLPFFRSEADPFEIKIPLLTPIEMRLLNRQLGKPAGAEPVAAENALPIPKAESDKFYNVRRYWPISSPDLV